MIAYNFVDGKTINKNQLTIDNLKETTRDPEKIVMNKIYL